MLHPRNICWRGMLARDLDALSLVIRYRLRGLLQQAGQLQKLGVLTIVSMTFEATPLDAFPRPAKGRQGGPQQERLRGCNMRVCADRENRYKLLT